MFGGLNYRLPSYFGSSQMAIYIYINEYMHIYILQYIIIIIIIIFIIILYVYIEIYIISGSEKPPASHYWIKLTLFGG